MLTAPHQEKKQNVMLLYSLRTIPFAQSSINVSCFIVLITTCLDETGTNY